MRCTMRGCIAIVLFFFLLPNIGMAQNLIPNPSFEELLVCPSAVPGGNIQQTAFWFTPTFSTDFFHTCATNPYWSVPSNVGYQYPRTGDAYAGMFIWVNPATTMNADTKEYLAVELKSVLEKDSFYRVKMFVNLNNKSNWACDCIDVLFSSEPLPNPFPEPNPDFTQALIEGNPQLRTPDGYFLKDTLEWMELCWIYQAQGNEQYMTIGSFEKNLEVNTFLIYPTPPSATIYYYFDDISVEKIPYHLANLALGEDRIACQPNISDTLTAHGFYTHYLWSTGDTTQSIIATQPGTYWVEGSTGGMCSLRDTIEIIYLSPDSLSLGDNIEICPQDLPVEIVAPAHMESYVWNTGDMSQELEIHQPGIYFLEATHACGVFKDTIQVAYFPEPEISLGNDTVFCGQPTFQKVLHAPAGFSQYEWSTGETTQQITATQSGIYWVNGTYQCGTVSDTIHLEYQPLLELNLGEDTLLCRGKSMILTVGEGFEMYAWSTGANTPAIEVAGYGLYSVEAAYPCGTLRDTIAILEPPLLELNLPQDTSLPLGEQLQILPEIISSGNLQYQWQPPDGLDCAYCQSPIASPFSNTIYALTIQDEYGCQIQDEIAIGVENRRRVYIPNAFSPNGDNVNDSFTVYTGKEVGEVLSLKIFDRWGELVFSDQHFMPGARGWNGLFNGKNSMSGAYAYLVEVAYLNGETEIFKGDLQLMR